MLAAYDAIADWYDRFVREGVFVSAEQVVEASGLGGKLAGLKVCDLGCGQGHLARVVAGRGARVTGIDISRRLLDIANREEAANPLRVVYVQADAQFLPSLSGEPFDAVFCNLALMDIPDLDRVLTGVSRVLEDGGTFVACITHPWFQYPKGREYTDEGFWRSDNPNGVRGQVGAYHRTLGTYMTSLGNKNLLIDRVAELPLPGYELPPALLIRCRKIDSQSSNP